jgi:hypothetical protein
MGVETAALISIASTALTTGLGIAGQAQKAAAEAGQAGYQAQVARNNQALAEINARNAEAQGQADAGRRQLEVAQTEAKQRAVLAAMGGDVNRDSNLDLLADTARAGATDVATLRSNAAWKAYGYRVQGLGYGAAADSQRLAAANATAALPFGIGSSLLTGASSIAGKWKDAFGSPGGSSGELLNYGAAAP